MQLSDAGVESLQTGALAQEGLQTGVLVQEQGLESRAPRSHRPSCSWAPRLGCDGSRPHPEAYDVQVKGVACPPHFYVLAESSEVRKSGAGNAVELTASIPFQLRLESYLVHRILRTVHGALSPTDEAASGQHDNTLATVRYILLGILGRLTQFLQISSSLDRLSWAVIISMAMARP